jgi:hypothetical protein
MLRIIRFLEPKPPNSESLVQNLEVSDAKVT